jgi:hypothetical protein
VYSRLKEDVAFRKKVAERLQHALGTDTQQIRDQAGQLNVGLFQKRLQLVL